MLVSLTSQALKERRRAYLAVLITLVIYLTGVIALTPVILRGGVAVDWIASAHRRLYWTVDYSANPAAGWIVLATYATALPAALSAAGMLHIRRWINAKRGSSQLPLLLSYPVSRGEIFLKVLLLQGGFLLTLALLSAAVVLIGSLAARYALPACGLLAMTAVLWLCCLFFSLITFLAGNLSGNSWLGVGIGAVVFLLAALIYLLPDLFALQPAIRWISPLTPCLDGNPLMNGVRAGNWLGMAAWTAAAGLAAWLHFERLDLGN